MRDEYISFKHLWQNLLERYGKKIAYFDHQRAYTYQDIDDELCLYQQNLSGCAYTHINGLEPNWLTQAIAAWTDDKFVIPFNPEWEKTDPRRFELAMSPPVEIDKQLNPHLLLFTSGTTAVPKPIIRTTAFALYEANAYLSDILTQPFDQAICLIKPWFGAITKHCLGMLLAGIPQYFSLAFDHKLGKKSLIYGTPSLITHQTQIHQLKWQAISLTGEPINAAHIQFFQECLEQDGFLLDSYGSTECGVIARRKVKYVELNQCLEGGFKGEILAGKALIIDEDGMLSVKGKHFPLVSVGDFVKQEDGQLHLLGRFSNQRKIRGVWHDVSPLLSLLSRHPDILQFHLSSKQSAQQQLIVYLCVKPHIQANDIYYWLYTYLDSIALFPQIIISHLPPALGVTGKQVFEAEGYQNQNEHCFISFMSDVLINGLPLRSSFSDQRLECQGFDSIDMVSLMMKLEQKIGKPIPGRTLLKTDTPRQIAAILNQDFSQNLLRDLSESFESKEYVICIGSGILCARHEITKMANLKYTDIIYSQNKDFHFSELGSQIIHQHWTFFSNTKKIYLAAYSINALLAIEMAYQLEMLNLPIQGLFLLDPPDLKRVKYLKRKKIFLKLRSKILRLMPQHRERYAYELRKLAISQQEKRSLSCPSLTLTRSVSENPFLELQKHHRQLKINDLSHLELVNTAKGVDAWLGHMLDDIASCLQE